MLNAQWVLTVGRQGKPDDLVAISSFIPKDEAAKIGVKSETPRAVPQGVWA
jgi:hypothetical protein